VRELYLLSDTCHPYGVLTTRFQMFTAQSHTSAADVFALVEFPIDPEQKKDSIRLNYAGLLPLRVFARRLGPAACSFGRKPRFDGLTPDPQRSREPTLATR
jgi:hypothetical protein